MVALANVALTDTFDTWRIRTNQIIVKGNEDELSTEAAFAKANAANVLAFNTGIGANAFTSATISGANSAVGTGANTYLLSVIAGANSAVGTGANAFTSATISGANNYLLSVISGANTAVGTGANAFTSVTIAGANSAVGAGANSYLLVVIAGANSAVGTGANSFTSDTVSGANTISIAAFSKANAALANTTGSVFNGILYVTQNVGIGITSSPAANLHVAGTIVATGDITSAYSDERLKNIIEPIQNATSKILTLDTFYYRPNKTALDLGIQDDRQVGVSAQQVQNVAPEVVKNAPIGDGYLTVQYERLVPLLIESIKELTDRIEKLENDIKNRRCNCRK